MTAGWQRQSLNEICLSYFQCFFLNYQFFIPAIKKNAQEHEGFIFVKIFSNRYVHWMAMVDGFSGMIDEANHGIQISVKFHVLTLNFRLFRLPHIFFYLLLHWKLMRTMNFRVRRVVISSFV
jgi:hypothetical protein